MKASRRRTRAFEVSSSCRRSAETLRDQNSIRHQDSNPSAAMILTGFVFLMLTAALSPAEGQDINFQSTSVILTCSGGEDGQEVTWTKDSISQSEKDQTLTVKGENGIVKGGFTCEYKDGEKTIKDFFYLNVKVCENCYELSGLLATGAIIGDLLVTGAVILIVYMCVSKNTGSSQQKASKSRTAGGTAPPPPNPDYERLNHNTRSTDLYAGLHK